MKASLTNAQRGVLEFVEERVNEGRNPPSYREICRRFGYKSTKAASDHIAALERKGLLLREKGCARSLRLTGRSTGIPILGRIPAGPPSEVSTEDVDFLQVDPAKFGVRRHGRSFAVRVMGDSMIGRHIIAGDLLLIEDGAPPRTGDVVAALIDNESTLKTFVNKNGKSWLKAENPLYPDLIPVVDLKIQGVARAVVRRLSA